MKKIIVSAVFLVFALSSVVFAGDAEIVVKAGITPVSSIETDLIYYDYYGYPYWNSGNSGADTGYQAALEFYYFLNPYIGLGGGVSQQFSRNIHNLGDVSYTSLYFSVKPRMPLSRDESNDLYGYLLGQFGFSFIQSDFDIGGYSINPNNGGYFGIGGGLQFHNVLLELMYSLNTSSIDSNRYVGYYYYDSAYQYYSSFYINIGYRFAIN